MLQRDSNEEMGENEDEAIVDEIQIDTTEVGKAAMR